MCKVVLDGFSGILDIQKIPREDPGNPLQKGMHSVNTQV